MKSIYRSAPTVACAALGGIAWLAAASSGRGSNCLRMMHLLCPVAEPRALTQLVNDPTLKHVYFDSSWEAVRPAGISGTTVD